MARRELTRAILEEARRQLTEVGPAALSVRAVARELGMASSAVYRYFATRDDLITALLMVSYDDLGSVAESGRRCRPASPRPSGALAGRRRRRCAPGRGQHPYDYALLYGSPVPGYAAPADTILPATRVIRVILDLVAEAAAAGADRPSRTVDPAGGPPGDRLGEGVRRSRVHRRSRLPRPHRLERADRQP